MSENITYKYKWRFLPAAWILAFAPLCVFLGVAWISRQGWMGGVIFLLVSLLLVILVGWVLVMGLANVSINNKGISRQAFGVTWQNMEWIAVRRIHISNSMNPENGKITRSYVLVASKEHSCLFSKRITFQERKSMTELLKKMNDCIVQHGIQVVDMSRR